MFNKKLLLVGIILFALGLRLFQLGNVPGSLDWDEVALGYNAYSILHTGKDEYGKFLPVILQSFNDYKPALYSYLIIPFILFFDLTASAVRLPSVLFGVISVISVYYIVKILFRNEQSLKGNENVALMAAFFTAISPWALQFSRVAFEANVGLSLNLLGALFFLLSLKRMWFLPLSALFFGINLYSYQSEKVFTPLLFLSLVLIFKKEILRIPKKVLLTSLVIGVIVLVPLLFAFWTDKNIFARAEGVSIFSNQTSLLSGNTLKLVEGRKKNDFIGIVLNNRRVILGKTILSNYLSHFDLNWVFILGDNARHHAPDMGLLYLFELPFLFIGSYQLFFGKWDQKTKLFIVTWILLSPVPASITADVPHAVRTLNIFPMLDILSALGVVGTYNYLNSSKFFFEKFGFLKKTIVGGTIILLMVNFFYYLDEYFVQQNFFNARYWQYGYKELVDYIQSMRNNYKSIVVSNRYELSQSYIFFLYYLKYDPSKYQSYSILNRGEEKTFSQYTFTAVDPNQNYGNSLIVVGPSESLPKGYRLIHEIKYPNNASAFLIGTR